jgi:hypothetical protein
VLVLTCGLVGTGKTTVAKFFKKNLGMELLSTDIIRKEMFEPIDDKEIEQLRNDPETLKKKDLMEYFDKQPEEIPHEIQQLIDEQRIVCYDEILRRTRQCLHAGKSVVLDGTFFKRALRERVYSIAKETGASVCLIHCVCNENVIVKRMKDRKNDGNTKSDVVKMDLYYKIKASFEDPLGDGMPIIRHHSDENTLEFFNKELVSPEEVNLLVNSLNSLIKDFTNRGNH